jgi:SAM-dependent methyltransferase
MPLSPKQQQLVADVKRKLETGEFRLINQQCPCLAGDADDDVCIAEIDRYGLPINSILCLACGQARADPYLNEESLGDFYAHYYQDLYARNVNLPHLFSYQRMHYGERIAACYDSLLNKDSSVLEIGCGTGSSLLAFSKRECFTAGCDFSGELVRYGTKQGIQNLWTGTIEDAPVFAAREYDLIYLFHVLEHVSQPVELLAQLRSKLTEGGRILAVVPDLSRIDVHRNPAGDALKFLHIAHKFKFSVIGLGYVAQQAGVSATRVTPPAREYGPTENARDLSEMWIEFRPDARHCEHTARAGEEVLRYLLATEQRFLAGECPAQLAIANGRAIATTSARRALGKRSERVRWYDKWPVIRTARRWLGRTRKKAA